MSKKYYLSVFLEPTRRYGPAKGFGLWLRLFWPLVKQIIIMLFWPILGHCWCSVVTSVTFSRNGKKKIKKIIKSHKRPKIVSIKLSKRVNYF